MANPEIDEEKNPAIQLYWLNGALLAIFVAILLSSTLFPSSNNTTGKSCRCFQGVGKYSGVVKKCCCDYGVMNHLNKEILRPLLHELVKRPFFRYFKVKLWCDCPIWIDDGTCHLRDCSVCECPKNEFSEPFKAQSHRHSSSSLVCLEGNPTGAVDRTIDSKAFKGWVEVDNPWTNDDETNNAEMAYVNLQLNPERYTGYSGPSARRIWDVIYTGNCPKNETGEIFPEKIILYKLISGVHSSISIHIAADYLFDEASNMWGHNQSLMYDRVLQFPDRVDNLYFTFLFVLHAVTKAGDYLDEASYDTGNPEDDLKTQFWMKQLVYHPKLKFACHLPFIEARLWKGQGDPDLMQQIQNQFRNISALMDCIGCEKCRLWGKLQVLGLGTALKIQFSINGQESLGKMLHLQWNEVIALINLLNQLSESVMLVHEIGFSHKK